MSAAIINLCREISAGHSKVSSACFSNLFVCYFVCDGRLPFRLKVPSSQKPFEVTSLNVNSKKREGSQLTTLDTDILRIYMARFVKTKILWWKTATKEQSMLLGSCCWYKYNFVTWQFLYWFSQEAFVTWAPRLTAPAGTWRCTASCWSRPPRSRPCGPPRPCPLPPLRPRHVWAWL